MKKCSCAELICSFNDILGSIIYRLCFTSVQLVMSKCCVFPFNFVCYVLHPVVTGIYLSTVYNNGCKLHLCCFLPTGAISSTIMARNPFAAARVNPHSVSSSSDNDGTDSFPLNLTPTIQHQRMVYDAIGDILNLVMLHNDNFELSGTTKR